VSKKLLISDANILIDMDAGMLLRPMFQMDYDFVTPDILFKEELEDQHPDLIDHGLRTLSLTGESVRRLVALKKIYDNTGVSNNDLSTLALAKQENAPLLTGERTLRNICISENQKVFGTLWIVGEMIDAALINVGQAEIAYQLMLADGSRLPKALINTQLQKFKAL